MVYKSSKGFSLIEVLISLVLFTSLSLSMMNVFNQTIRSEKQIEKFIRSNRAIQNITSAIKKDLQTIIYILPSNILQRSYQHYKLSLQDSYEGDYMTDYFPENNKPFIRKSVYPKMGFEGDENSFYFTSPLSTDAAFSTVRVAYVIEPCPNEGTIRCLMRKTAPLDQKLSSEWNNSEFEKKQVLLKNVETFQIEYFNQEEWLSEFRIPIRRGLFFPLPLPSALRIVVKFEDQNMDFYVPFYSTLLSNKITSPSLLNINRNSPSADEEPAP